MVDSSILLKEDECYDMKCIHCKVEIESINIEDENISNYLRNM